MFSQKLGSSTMGAWRKLGSMLLSLAAHGLIVGILLLSAVLATQNVWDDCRPRIQVGSLNFTPRPGDPHQLEQQPNTRHIPQALVVAIDPNTASKIPVVQSTPMEAINNLLGPVAQIPSVDIGRRGVCGCVASPYRPPQSNPIPIDKVPPLEVQSRLHEAVLVREVDPEYPMFAKRAGIHGAVVIHATIDREGAVTAVAAVSGPQQLRQAAVDAVRQWRYQPYILNGIAVEVKTTITVNFVLPGAGDQNLSRVL